jgi:hypothetical protein
MKVIENKACCAVLLALVFLLAQFHFCADLSSGSNTHFCPFCSTAATAITSQPPVLGITPAGIRLEIAVPQIGIATTVATSISPRAPPALQSS